MRSNDKLISDTLDKLIKDEFHHIQDHSQTGGYLYDTQLFDQSQDSQNVSVPLELKTDNI